MWGTSEDPPGTTEMESAESVVHAKEKCEENKNQLESLKEIMFKSKKNLEKKEEELQEYARRLSKIKSRARLLRKNKGGNTSSKDVPHASETSMADISDESIDDVEQAKTAKTSSTIYQKNLTPQEFGKKVAAIRQQLKGQVVGTKSSQKDQFAVTSFKPVMVTSEAMSSVHIEPNSKVFELQATVVDLEENLKTTFDIAGDTKDEIRTTQEPLEEVNSIKRDEKVSDANAEIARLQNEVASLKEEKGNLQQSLKELHIVKEEISSLEAENAEAESLRVTAEMKVVELEEQLEVMHRLHNEKLEEKGTSDAGSTESFEAIQDMDKTDMTKNIEDSARKNIELTLKLSEQQEKENSFVGSMEIIGETERNELLRKIDQLTRENAALSTKLTRIEESATETESPESIAHGKEKCEENKDQLDAFKEITLKSKQSLGKKEEELQEYARRLSKIKSRVKLLRRNKDGNTSSKDVSYASETSVVDILDEGIDDISQAKTAKAKSTLLQKKLAEDRKAFEQRNKEISESLEEFEETVEAIRQQLKEQDAAAMMCLQSDQLSVAPIKPIMVTSEIMSPVQIESIHEKDYKIAELNSKVLELQATIVDLQENLKEKDSVIDSKMKAVTLMSADLSKRGKTTLDTLEDTKDEMRMMQEHFVLLETSLKNKNENLLMQLQERDGRISELEDTILRLQEQIDDTKSAESASADFTRSTMDTLMETTETMKSMQVSDTNAELVRSGSQVALLEEEKGNLQLNQASAGDWQERVFDLESKVSAQTKEIEMQIEAIAILEDQKMELVQELHMVKEEISNLEAENAESENLRVTAEMKVVELEEQLELMHRLKNESKMESSSEFSHEEMLKQMEVLTHENAELYNRISKLEEKATSDSGSTESFEAIQDLDKTDVLKKIEDLTRKNSELTHQLAKLQEKENSCAGSIEMIDEMDRNELLKKIDRLTQENADLSMKLHRIEEKGSSDTGSTESFERIPEHNENVELKSDIDAKLKIDTLLRENENQSAELAKLRLEVADLFEENNRLHEQINALSADNIDFAVIKSQAQDGVGKSESSKDSEVSKREVDFKEQIDMLTQEKILLENEVKELRNSLDQSHNASQDLQVNDLSEKIEELSKENEEIAAKVSELQSFNDKLNNDLSEVMQEKEKLHAKLSRMLRDDSNNESMGLVEKLEKLELSTMQEKQDLQSQIDSILEKYNKVSELPQSDESLSTKVESMIVDSLEKEIEECKKLIAEQTGLIEEMKIKLASKESELEEKSRQIMEYGASGKRVESLEEELKEMLQTIEEWKFKCSEMQEKMEKLEAAKASIEEGFKMLQNENEMLLEEKKAKNAEAASLKQQLQDTTTKLESELQKQLAVITEKENEIASLQEAIAEKEQELRGKYMELQNHMILIDSLQDQVHNCKMLIKDKESLLTSMSTEVESLTHMVKTREDDICALKKEIHDLNERMANFRPIEDYNQLLEQLKDKDMILNELQYRINASTKENSNLLEKVKNLSQQNSDVQNQLAEKQQDLDELMETKEQLETQMMEARNDKSEAERRLWELQATLDNNAKFADDLRAELQNSYKQMEQLKVKHTEDNQLQNQRLENLYEELNSKMQECETLRGQLEEKEKLIGQNVTADVKADLEAKIAEAEQRLRESEDKIQTQLEKMRKIAANLKKKTATCQELESRVAELEEKWTTEKDEKEAKNKQIQDVEMAMREKDNRIADLEEKLARARNESAEASRNIDGLTNDLTASGEKISLLNQQVTEMTDEIARLRGDVESSALELEAEREGKQSIILEWDSYKQQVAQENERKREELEEMKEKARELSVRMQVMETEYVEQLALINNLKTENGLLLSKQAQINERLENAEQESEERSLLIKRMEKGSVSTSTAATQVQEEEVTEVDAKTTGSQRCSYCEQCQTLVQALEAKLQEREAEIENLDNELANSVGNFVQMRESIRFNDLMNQTGMRNRSLEDTYNELLFQYNSLVSSNEELKARLEEALQENKALEGKIEELQSLNATLQERMDSTGQTLEDNTQNVERLQAEDPRRLDLIKKFEEREAELLNMQQQMQQAQARADQMQEQLNSQVDAMKSLEAQKAEAKMLLDDAKSSLEQEIRSLRADKEATEKRIEDLQVELEVYRNQSAESVEKAAVKEEASVFAAVPQDNVPQLFDAAKIFGTPSVSDSDLLANKEVGRLQTLLQDRETQCFNLTQEIKHLQQLMMEERAQISQNYSERVQELEVLQRQLHGAHANLERLEQQSAEKEEQIGLLSAELRNVSMQLEQQQSDMGHEVRKSLLEKDNQLQELRASLDSMKEALNRTVSERDQQHALLETYKLQISDLETELRNSSCVSDIVPDLEGRISALTKERDLLQLQVNDLSRSMEEVKDSADAGRNLQTEMEKAIRERDEAKELIASLTRALEDVRSQSDKTTTDSSTKESTPLEESTVQQAEQVVAEDTLQEGFPDIGSTWDTGSAEKLNVDEETWGWNAEDAQLAGDQQLTATLVPSVEMQLRAKIDDLQDQIKDLQKEKDKLLEDGKTAQLRNAKMIKKLKEYKAQADSLQQQLKIQKSAGDFYELDSAIEEELKSQISQLERTLAEVKEEQKNTQAEKEALSKRVDVLVSANERYMEMKERQDMDVEVLRIRNKELSEKLEALDRRSQGADASLPSGLTEASINDPPRTESSTGEGTNMPVAQDRLRKRSVDGEDFEALCKKYRDEIDDLKDEMEALATENEQLQQFLEEQKVKLSRLESERTNQETESIQIVDDLNVKISELQGMLGKSRQEYDLLRKQYEQSLVEANEQVTIMRQNVDYLKEEAFEKSSKLEKEVAELRQQLGASESNVAELQGSLRAVLEEKAGLEDRVSSLNATMTEVTDLLNIRIQEVADLKQELQRKYVDHEESTSKLQDKIRDLNREVNEKRQELEDLRESRSVRETESMQQQSVETVSALVSQATQELVQRHAIEIEDKEKEIRMLKERTSTLEEAIAEQLTQKEDVVLQLDGQRQELELLRQGLSEKESILASVQANLSSTSEQLAKKQSELSESRERLRELSEENQKFLATMGELRESLSKSNAESADANEYLSRVQSLEREVESSRNSLAEKEAILERYAQESAQLRAILESNQIEIGELRGELQKAETAKRELLEKTEQVKGLMSELEATRRSLEETRTRSQERQMELGRSFAVQQDQHQQRSSNVIDGLPVFRMVDSNEHLQHTVDAMQAELESKREEIEHLKYILSENTYPSIIQEMQESINCLYNEKAELQSSLEVVRVRAEEKEKEIVALKERMEMQSREFVSKEEANLLSRDRRNIQEQEQIVMLQNELYAKEQEIGELKYVIAEKESQLSLQASMEPQSDDFELRDMVQRLTADLYGKEQEIVHLKSAIAELQEELVRLREFERISAETRDAVEKLQAEKEQVRLEAQQFLEQKLIEKEMEIDEVKQRLSQANRSLLEELQLRDRDIDNLRLQLQELTRLNEKMKDESQQKDEELLRASADLAEKERRLAELSITKDTELHNLRVQIRDKEARIEELLALSDEEEQQIKELKIILEARETEINSLKVLLEEKVKEYELIQNVLKKDVPVIGTSAATSADVSGEGSKESTSQELDFALYMLHQRDVRCEELTQELMQLLEERDTLQLRLSNAIRVNEELRKIGGSSSTDLGNKTQASTSDTVEPLVEHPSPSKSEGPVEIAKEAIDTPLGEDREALALKLSQLHTVNHAKDVRLRDDRELRHTQQMSLLAHKDVLSTLPPEAAARLVNANYTLSRNVQSQSSVLLNWLWGKSTPKVVHM